MDLTTSVQESRLAFNREPRRLCIIGHSGDDEIVLWRGAAAGPNHALLQAGLTVVLFSGERVRLDLNYELIGGDAHIETIRVLDEALMTKAPADYRAPATDDSSTVEPTMLSASSGPKDPTVRDLSEAMGILASLRDDPEAELDDLAWSMLNHAHWHVQRSLRSHFTGH